MSGLPDTLRQQVEALLLEGRSDLDVHRQTGAARDTVARYRKALGLPGYRVTEDSPTCRNGHPFPENAFRDSDGWLHCRSCVRASSSASKRNAYTPAQPDEVAIDRAVAGEPPQRFTPRERRAAIAQLDRRQLSAAVIAERVRCSRRTVHRARSKAVAA